MNCLICRLFSKFLIASLLLFSLPLYAALRDIEQVYKQIPALHHFSVCAGGGCVELMQVSLTDEEWQIIKGAFSKAGEVNTAEEERALIALTIGAFENIVGVKTNTLTDRAGTFGNSNYPGQMDCNDEAINSTTYMRLMQQHGLIKFHEIEDMRTRNFFFSGWPHTTAVIREVATGARFAVDSWFYDNGFPASIVPFSVWKSGYIPKDSPILKR